MCDNQQLLLLLIITFILMMLLHDSGCYCKEKLNASHSSGLGMSQMVKGICLPSDVLGGWGLCRFTLCPRRELFFLKMFDRQLKLTITITYLKKARKILNL